MRFLHKRLTNHGTKIDFIGRPQLPFDIISFHNSEYSVMHVIIVPQIQF